MTTKNTKTKTEWTQLLQAALFHKRPNNLIPPNLKHTIDQCNGYEWLHHHNCAKKNMSLQHHSFTCPHKTQWPQEHNISAYPRHDLFQRKEVWVRRLTVWPRKWNVPAYWAGYFWGGNLSTRDSEWRTTCLGTNEGDRRWETRKQEL